MTSTSFHFVQKKGERQHHPEVEEGTTTQKEEEGKAVLLQRRLGKAAPPKKRVLFSLTSLFSRLKRKLVTSISLHVIQKKKGETAAPPKGGRRSAHHAKAREGKQHHPQRGGRESTTTEKNEEGKAAPTFSLLYIIPFYFYLHVNSSRITYFNSI